MYLHKQSRSRHSTLAFTAAHSTTFPCLVCTFDPLHVSVLFSIPGRLSQLVWAPFMCLPSQAFPEPRQRKTGNEVTEYVHLFFAFSGIYLYLCQSIGRLSRSAVLLTGGRGGGVVHEARDGLLLFFLFLLLFSAIQYTNG